MDINGNQDLRLNPVRVPKEGRCSMKLFDADWVEVYLSTDYEEYLRKQIMLREGGMKFKAKTRNNSLRFSMNFLGGRIIMSSWSGGRTPRTQSSCWADFPAPHRNFLGNKGKNNACD